MTDVRDKDIEVAFRQLELVLSFFPRLESKSTAVFSVNIGVIIVMFANITFSDISRWQVTVPLIIGILCNTNSLYKIFQASYPQTKGGMESSIYYAQIARMTEFNFIEKIKKRTNQDLYSDLLGQVWRNSEILDKKTSIISKAYFWTTISIIPWSIFIVVSSVINMKIPTLN